MTQEIYHEATVLLYSLLIGVAMVFGYDIFLALRRAIRHAGFFIFLQDFLFLAACTVSVFIMFYINTSGVIRGYAVGGMIAGMIFYKKTLSQYVVLIMSTIVKKTIYLVSAFLKILLKPAKCVFSRISKVSKSTAKMAKKGGLFCYRHLTVCIKLSKITLCKHSSKENQKNVGKRKKRKRREEHGSKNDDQKSLPKKTSESHGNAACYSSCLNSSRRSFDQ